MARNLYYVVCTDRSEYNIETPYDGKRPIRYVALVPTGYDVPNTNYHTTHNTDWFWAAPGPISPTPGSSSSGEGLVEWFLAGQPDRRNPTRGHPICRQPHAPHPPVRLIFSRVSHTDFAARHTQKKRPLRSGPLHTIMNFFTALTLDSVVRGAGRRGNAVRITPQRYTLHTEKQIIFIVFR